MSHEGEDILLLPGAAGGHDSIRIPHVAADKGGAHQTDVQGVPGALVLNEGHLWSSL